MEPPELSRHCIPWTPFTGKIEEARVCLLSSAGVRRRDDAPFDPSGDQSFREIPGDAKTADLAYDDEHYDHACVDRDLNCIFPVDRLHELAAEGRIGAVARKHFSFAFSMKLRELKEETFPRLVKEIEKIHPSAVLLTGGWPLCHRTVVTVQRFVELRGIPTVVITASPEDSAQAGPPRGLSPREAKPGHSLVRAGDADLQKRVLLDALDLLVHPVAPGQIVVRDYSAGA